jgi:hypothetical protein
MPPSREFERLFWKIFNVLGRVIGVGFILVGIIISSWALGFVLDPKATIPVNGMPTNDGPTKALVFILPLIVSIVGVLLLFARPYRPDDQK